MLYVSCNQHCEAYYAHFLLIMHYLVLRVQFSSANFSGLESSGKVLVNIVVLGGTPNNTDVIIKFEFIEITASSKFNTHLQLLFSV